MNDQQQSGSTDADPTKNPHEAIATEKIINERKIFFLDLKENQRGRFLRITESLGGRRNNIMLPASAFRDFLEAMTRLVDYESQL